MAGQALAPLDQAVTEGEATSRDRSSRSASRLVGSTRYNQRDVVELQPLQELGQQADLAASYQSWRVLAALLLWLPA